MGRGGLRAARARPAENQAHTPATTSPPRQASTANPTLALAIGQSRYSDAPMCRARSAAIAQIASYLLAK